MFGKVLTAVLNLLLFRAGPAEFPYDPRLGSTLIAIAALVGYAVQLIVYPPAVAAAMSLATIIGLAFATRVLLRLRKLEGRFTQTYHALLAVNGVMTLGLWPALASLAPELQRISKDPTVLEGSATMDLPAGPAALIVLLSIWNFAVNAYIFNHAANLGPWRGVSVALMVALGLQMFVLFFAALAAAITGSPAAS